MLQSRQKVSSVKNTTGNWLHFWELYVIVGIALFLYFYQLQTAEFDFDQAMLWRMAHDAISYGLIPMSSNTSSIGFLHQPIFVYLLVPAAAFTSHPLGGSLTSAFFCTATVVLVYFFTRRYFGRFPATITALLGLTASVPFKYTRMIWQPNVLPFFMILFLFSIYRGAVERKSGWLFPTLALMGIIYQLHPSSIVGLILLIGLTIMLAPKTVRVKDVLFGVASLAVLFTPYLLWQSQSGFADIKVLMTFSRASAQTDLQIIKFYSALLDPYHGVMPRVMTVLQRLSIALTIAGFVLAISCILFPWRNTSIPVLRKHPVLNWWNTLRNDPRRVAFLLLVVWQLFPFLLLFRHAVDLHMQYMLAFLPGPFLLSALFLTWLAEQLQRFRPQWKSWSYGISVALAFLLIGGQFVATTMYMLDRAHGQYKDRLSSTFYYNDIASIWDAAMRADEVARIRKIHRVYLTMDPHIYDSMVYVAEQMKTPTTVFGSDRCLVLPAPSSSPALMLVGPYATQIEDTLKRYAKVTLLEQPKRTSGAPFRLYLVEPKVAAKPLVSNFAGSLQALNHKPQVIRFDERNFVATSWQIERSAVIQPRVVYKYEVKATFGQTQKTSATTCSLSSLHPGDQLVASLVLPEGTSASEALQFKANMWDVGPDQRKFGPITVVSGKSYTINRQQLKTANGSTTIAIP